ncbi:DNA-binding domain-containing protein [Novosphingobium sp. BL-52-GroH]|uniref:HvfC/BufC N-terminal domain-containing protein n=1 Tax=Novosphingobium sp. BL-52-GroH TaxID=3349877 RepID=UPI00384E7B12
MNLLSLQRDMQSWLVLEDAEAAGRMGAAAAPGLAVYQNTYRSQLVACLESSFARTRAWIGDTAFLRAAALHIDGVPPSSWTLDAYSQGFPATLDRLHAEDPEVAEIAWIELALEEAFVAADHEVLGIDGLHDIDWENAVLHFAPALRIVHLSTNAFAIWSALGADRVPPPVSRLDEAAGALVWRQGDRSIARLVEGGERRALIEAPAGVSFGQLCVHAAECFGEERGAMLSGQWLGRWIADGLIHSIGSGR